jgi:anti-sigma factor RsiW
MKGWWARRPLMCPEVGRLLQRNLDGEIDELKARRIARHLEDCRRCGMKAETYSAIKRTLREHRPSVSADTVERLRSFAERLAAEGPDDESADGSTGA